VFLHAPGALPPERFGVGVETWEKGSKAKPVSQKAVTPVWAAKPTDQILLFAGSHQQGNFVLLVAGPVEPFGLEDPKQAGDELPGLGLDQLAALFVGVIVDELAAGGGGGGGGVGRHRPRLDRLVAVGPVDQGARR